MKNNKVAIYYSNKFGRNDGPPLYYWNVLKHQLKLDVKHLLPEGDLARFGKFNYHFWVDWGEDALGMSDLHIPKDGGKTIYVVSDAHLDNGYRFKKAQEFDYIFFNQAHYLDKYQPLPGQKVFYLPHAAEPTAYPYFEIIKKYDLCFIGHMQEYHKGNTVNTTRLDALDIMFKAFPNFYFGTRHPAWPDKNIFDDASKKFCQSKVVFNISVGNDLNMRFFEVLSSGSFLLTNWIPELESVPDLIDGEHYVSYKTMAEAIEKATYYIEHDSEREKIAKAGHRAFLKNHTYKHRVEAILQVTNFPYKSKKK